MIEELEKIPRKIFKIDESKIDLDKTATWNVWAQFSVDIETYRGEKIDVTTFYMPDKEQDKLLEFMSKNYRKLKQYKRKKKIFDNHSAWERLSFFPTSVEEGVKNDG